MISSVKPRSVIRVPSFASREIAIPPHAREAIQGAGPITQLLPGLLSPAALAHASGTSDERRRAGARRSSGGKKMWGKRHSGRQTGVRGYPASKIHHFRSDRPWESAVGSAID
jgi:hypothetical protein